MKILLIDPPFYRFIGYYNRYYPLGLSYLAAVLQKNKHQVFIYDADSNVNPIKMNFAKLEDSYPVYIEALNNNEHYIWKEIDETIRKYNPDIIGISVWTTYAASAFKIASICKSIKKDLKVVMGGPHVTIKYDEIANICKDVDFLVRGEGENTLLELINTLGKSDNARNFKDIDGLSYKNNGIFTHNKNREFINNLDDIPFPARELLINKKSYNSEDMGLFMSSRGCPYCCAYCATNVWGRKIRYRSVTNVIEEIKMVIKLFGTKQFTFKDDCFTINKKRVEEFCNELMNNKININWECNIRVDNIDENMLRIMKKAGCNFIKVGIETGSQRMLDLMNKKIQFQQAIEASRMLRKSGIHWTAYFMIGLPSETKNDMMQTLKFMKELKPDYASLSVYEAFPGTGLFKLGIEKGLVENDRKLKDFFRINPKYYYVKDINNRIDTMNEKDFKVLEEQIKKEFFIYNRNCMRLFKRAISRGKLYLSNISFILNDFKKLISWIRN